MEDAGALVDWKPLKRSPQTGKNRWGWDQSKPLLSANLVAAWEDYLQLGY